MTETAFSGKTVFFQRCSCCIEAGCGQGGKNDMALQEKQVICPVCDEPCNCPGCEADRFHADEMSGA